MKVLSANPTKDVGLCTDVDLTQKESLGVYTPARLLDWAKMLVELYGDDTEVQVQVFTHSSCAVKAKSLVASEDGDNPYVIVISWEEK